jgi:hypothetical protein
MLEESFCCFENLLLGLGFRFSVLFEAEKSSADSLLSCDEAVPSSSCFGPPGLGCLPTVDWSLRSEGFMRPGKPSGKNLLLRPLVVDSLSLVCR